MRFWTLINDLFATEIQQQNLSWADITFLVKLMSHKAVGSMRSAHLGLLFIFSPSHLREDSTNCSRVFRVLPIPMSVDIINNHYVSWIK